jgi:HEAT repeat protein
MNKARWFALLVATLSVSRAFAVGPVQPSPEAALLRKWRVSTTTKGLIKFLKERTPDDRDLGRVDALVRLLGNDDFETREDATRRLTRLGWRARAALERVRDDRDPEVKRRARGCIASIDGDMPESIALAIRVLRQRDGRLAAPALVALLPSARMEDMEEAAYALAELCPHGAIPALEAAAKDKEWRRRAVAGLLLGRYGDARQKGMARRLLRDTAPEVRLRAAQGLLGAGERAGLGVLVGLLKDAPIDVAWQAEELLRWAAGEGSPDGTIVACKGRAACVRQWDDWLRAKGKIAGERWPGRPGLFLVCQPGQDDKPNGRAWLCGYDGNPRWVWGGLRNPTDARPLSGGRVLVAESPANGKGGVTERGPDGKVVWECRRFTHPAQCLRLQAGQTFIAARNWSGAIIGPDGKVAVSLGSSPRRLLRDVTYRPFLVGSDLVLVGGATETWGLGGAWLYKPGIGGMDSCALRPSKEVRREYKLERTPSAGFLLSGTKHGEILEANNRTQQAWSYVLLGHTHAVRLRDGSTAIISRGRLLRVNEAGQMVSEVLFEGGACRVRECFGLLGLGFSAPPIDMDFVALLAHRCRGLKRGTEVYRWRSAQLLGELGRNAYLAAPHLKAATKDTSERVRRVARVALTLVGEEAFAKYVADLRGPNVEARREAVDQLGSFYKAPRLVTPHLLAAARNPDAEVRWRAVNVLPNLRSEAGRVVPTLIGAMEDPNADVRWVAINALGRLGPLARPAIPALMRTLRDKNGRLCAGAAHSLSQIISPDSVAFRELIKILGDKSEPPSVTRSVIFTLRYLGPRARAALPALVAARGRDRAIDLEIARCIRAIKQKD